MALQTLPITATTTTTISSRSASPLPFSRPGGGPLGLRRPSERFALKSFSLPSVHRFLLPAGVPRVAATAPTLFTRVASNKAHICRDCGYVRSGMAPFEMLPDKYSCPESSRMCYFTGIEKAFGRRTILFVSTVGLLSGFFPHALESKTAIASEFADMPALRGKDYGKTKMRYPDYIETESGLQYKDLRVGDGPTPKNGETVVVDWAGYTIGYYGRIFEARNKTKGGSFEGDDKDFFKFKLGSNQVIPAFEEAVAGMASGGIRRIVVPPELGYPDNDYNKLGPKPTTFSGQRALDFVLRNQGLIDKTLLFDIELVKTMPN